jgi:hypothetical protein
LDPVERVALAAAVPVEGLLDAAAAATYKSGFGHHPMLAWLDNTGEERTTPPTTPGWSRMRWRRFLTAIGTAPDLWSCPTGASGTRGFLDYLRNLHDRRGLDVSFSVGFKVTNAVTINRSPASSRSDAGPHEPNPHLAPGRDG